MTLDEFCASVAGSMLALACLMLAVWAWSLAL
jgi:hypothetical protein